MSTLPRTPSREAGVAHSRWWGWGGRERGASLDESARSMLVSLVGEAQPSPAVDIDAVSLPEPAPLPEGVNRIVGSENVRTGTVHRILHAAGSSYPDLIRRRSGLVENAPDAVVAPADRHEVRALLEACAAEEIAVVPFGGGTSVVGGVEALRERFGTLVSLDLSRLRSVAVDRRSLVALLGAGLTGPQAESALGAQGLTLGHFPQSFERATVGGFAATRSAGQASCGYGRFDELVTSVRLSAPVGELRTIETPHSAAGPSLRELVLGSEGVLGVITEVSARIRPAPQMRRYEGWMAPDFISGSAIIRDLAQGDVLPDVVRLSDRDETRVSVALSVPPGASRRALDAYLGLRRRSRGCVVIVGWEGGREAVRRRSTLARRRLRAGGAISLGARPGRSWHRGRYQGPFLRDELLDLGYIVETLETAHTWSRLSELYEAVRGAIVAALEAQGTPGLVLCHVSHVYRDGASLYFTFLAPRKEGGELDQWRAVKQAACEAIVTAGGTITHHHAVGRDHAPYMNAELGELGIDALRAVKQRLDPVGIMNPGKLLA